MPRGPSSRLCRRSFDGSLPSEHSSRTGENILMQCPYCQSEETRVLESRKDGAGTVQRRRSCMSCGERFSTVERINVEYLNVRKYDGRIERFQRDKIARGIGKAASLFQIPAADVNAFIDRILDELRPDQ